VPVLDEITLLSVWETGTREPPLRRALELLSAACPERSPESWRQAPVGERDARLLDLREHLFGSEMEMLAACPDCAELLEVVVRCSDVRAQTTSAAEQQSSRRGRLLQDGYEVEYRPPASDDLLAVAGFESTQAVSLLLDRCIVFARQDDEKVDKAVLPASLRRAIEEAISTMDPGAEVKVELECARCGHRWSVLFDIVSYLWSELEDWAQRTTKEVHALALAYGWSEREIFSVSQARRRMYLELVAG
jgi:hypothetical protein